PRSFTSSTSRTSRCNTSRSLDHCSAIKPQSRRAMPASLKRACVAKMPLAYIRISLCAITSYTYSLPLPGPPPATVYHHHAQFWPRGHAVKPDLEGPCVSRPCPRSGPMEQSQGDHCQGWRCAHLGLDESAHRS